MPFKFSQLCKVQKSTSAKIDLLLRVQRDSYRAWFHSEKYKSHDFKPMFQFCIIFGGFDNQKTSFSQIVNL